MCGIAGVVEKQDVPSDRGVLEGMVRVLRHRGPDGHGLEVGRGRCWANVRLAIVGVVGGEQPVFNETGDVGIVYNGEVYNHKELRRELEAKGHRFRTQTDTEVVVHLFEEFGPEGLSRLEGMFAFALWDRDATYLVRDRVGIKPLYVYEDERRILFASEVRSILTATGGMLPASPEGVLDFLTYRYVPGPRTVLRGLRKVVPGTYLRIGGGTVQERRYASIASTPSDPHPDDAAVELMDLLRESVRGQLMGEVPIGLTLSGGVDSSAIAAVLHELGANLKTFNIGFPETHEFYHSDLVAQRFGLSHTMVLMSRRELARYFLRVIDAIDEPIADAACIPLFRLCEEIAKHVTVVLSGEGGDELFGGYPQYRAVMEAFREPSEKAFELFLDRSWYFRDSEKFLCAPRTFTPAFPEAFKGDRLLEGMLHYDLRTWMPDDLMMKADKILMAHSLEGRFPFLDSRLIRFALGLPSAMKIAVDGTSKWILKRAMRSHLPAEVIARPKMGFTVPIDVLLHESRTAILDALDADNPLFDVLDWRNVRAHVENYYAGRHGETLRVFTLAVLTLWFERMSATAHDRIDRNGEAGQVARVA